MNSPIQQLRASPPSRQRDEQEDVIDLRKHADFILDSRWLITGVAVAVLCLGMAYAYIAKPIYRTSILVQLEDNASSGASKNVLGDLPAMVDPKTAAASEIEVLRSRQVVSQAVDDTKLYLDVQPKYFPLVGAWLARRSERLSEPGLFGHGGYVWGAERVDVTLFNVPDAFLDQAFVLTAAEDGHFRLSNKNFNVEATGKTGSTLRIHSPQGPIELHVEHLSANPGAEFRITRMPRFETVEALQKALKIIEKGKQSGVIEVSLEGENPRQISSILNGIGRQYIHQDEDRRAEGAEKTLAFLNKQLPELKQELNRSEAKYNDLRNSRKTVDLGEEAKVILQQSAAAHTRLIELKQKRDALLNRYTSEHPEVEAINQQIKSLSRELASVDAKIQRLPAVEQDVLRLSRDVKVNTDAYTGLLSSAQQLRLLAASKVGKVRVLDMPETPTKPVKPNRMLITALAGVIGLLVGIAVAYFRKMLFGGVSDPWDIRQSLGLPVSATIPHSAGQAQLHARIRRKKIPSNSVSVLAQNDPHDIAVESLRGFRASLRFAMREMENNIIVITSPAAGVGKSFVSANLAAVLASFGKKVLLIDADLRKGQLHSYFGVNRQSGLSDVLSGALAFDKATHKDVIENVDFISSGNPPKKPAELLGNERFDKLLRSVSHRYDAILIDTAPILSVSDALMVAPHAGATFNIVRAGASTVSEIEESVKRLNEAGVKVTGIIFNDLKPGITRYGYGERYRRHQYVEQ